MVCDLVGIRYSNIADDVKISVNFWDYQDGNVIINDDIILHNVKIDCEHPEIKNGSYADLEVLLRPEIKQAPDFTFQKKYLDDFKKKFPEIYAEKFPESHVEIFKLSGIDDNGENQNYKLYFLNEGFDEYYHEDFCSLGRIEKN